MVSNRKGATSKNMTITLSSFELFPRLPPEIRLKIWANALPLFPRLLTLSPVRWNDTIFPTTLPPDFRTQPKWTLSTPPTSPLLRVNREARYELLPVYFAFQPSGIDFLKAQNMLFCPAVDVLHINVKATQKIYDGGDALWNEVFGSRAKDVKRGLKRLAGSRRFWEDGSGNLFGEFPSLEDAALVVSSQTLRIVREEGSSCGVKFGDGEGGMLCLDDLCEDETGLRKDNKGEVGRKIKMRVCAAADLMTSIRRW